MTRNKFNEELKQLLEQCARDGRKSGGYFGQGYR